MQIKPFLFAGAFCAGIGAANLNAAECNVTHHQGSGGSTDVYMGYPATALYLFEGNYLDLSKMNLREPAVKNASSTDTAWVYRSALDSTMIVIVTEKVVKVARVTYSDDEKALADSLFTVKHKDVYKDEFPRLQKAGVFKGTAEQADSLVTHVFDLCQKFYSKDLGYAGCVFNPPEQRGRNGGKDIDMVDMPLALAAVAGEFTILQLAENIIELTGSKSKIVRMPLPSDDPRQRRPDITKATELLGCKHHKQGFTAALEMPD